MNPQLAAFFNTHKPAVLAGGAAAVVALALYQRKKKAGTTPTTAGATVPGTIPAAVVAGSTPATGGGTYDSSAYDVYNALQPEFSNLEQQMQTGGVGSGAASATPTPIASTLFAPSASSDYVRYGSSIFQVQPDGTLFAPTYDQWQQAAAQGATYAQVSPQDTAAPKYYTTAGNLAAKNPAA